jgi:hypothetical protein
VAFTFNTCESCFARFKVKEIKKPYVGMYKNNPVFHWHYDCVSCGYVHTVRLYNVFVNERYDKVMSLQFSMWMNRKDEEKYQELSIEYEIAKNELYQINEIVKRELF